MAFYIGTNKVFDAGGANGIDMFVEGFNLGGDLTGAINDSASTYAGLVDNKSMTLIDAYNQAATNLSDSSWPGSCVIAVVSNAGVGAKDNEDTVSGSDLAIASFGATTSGTLPGTWRLKGKTHSAGSGKSAGSFWVRIT